MSRIVLAAIQGVDLGLLPVNAFLFCWMSQHWHPETQGGEIAFMHGKQLVELLIGFYPISVQAVQ
jgi:hypothetical protein